MFSPYGRPLPRVVALLDRLKLPVAPADQEDEDADESAKMGKEQGTHTGDSQTDTESESKRLKAGRLGQMVAPKSRSSCQPAPSSRSCWPAPGGK
jgi:hypothetical protein